MATRTLYPSIAPSLDLNFASSKTLDPRITFSRASAATYYDGKTVAKAEENIYTYSQDFSNGIWVKNLSTVVSNSTTAPDGTATASKFVSSPSNGYQYITQSISSVSEGSQVVISLYAKASEYTKLQISNQSSGNLAVRFDLVTGSVISSSGTNFVSASAVSFGSGWYRCVVVFNKVGTVLPTISGYPDNAILSSYAPSYTGDGTSGIYIWGAQLEQRSQVTAYTPTTTQPITNYIPVLQTALAGVPRFDHNPVTGESLGLLVEEQRTNLLTYSEQFDNGSWGKNNIAVEHNAAIAPDGTLTSDKLVPATGNTTHNLSKSYISSSGTYTASLYVKPAGYHRLRFYLNDSVTGDSYAIVNFATETITGSGVNGSWTNNSSTLTKLANGWFRVSVTGTQGAGSSVSLIALVMNNEGSGTFTGDGYSGIYIWGAQLEAGSFPTSYIKTEASQVTRAADSASMTGANFSSWYRQDEGSIFAEFQQYPSVPSLSQRVLQVGASGTNDGHLIFRTNDRFNAGTYFSGTYQASFNLTDAGSEAARNKVCYSYKPNSFSGAGNGKVSAEDTSGIVPINSTLYIGSATSNILNGYIRRISYYPKRLTEAQLQAMTL